MTGSHIIDRCYERVLQRQVTHIPRHVAIIQDGNRRFARLYGLDTASGHRAGASTTENMLEWVQELGIRHITLYSFSTENFTRPHKEVRDLFALFKDMLVRISKDERIHRRGVCVRIIGDRSLLPDDLLESVRLAEEATQDYTDFHLNIALAYGGRNEIVYATRSILEEVRSGRISPDSIDTGVIDEHLYNGFQLPPVDLMIRTGNEKRTSNFLPWHANGSESAVYFCAPFWPQFRRIDLLRAVRLYDQRVKMSLQCP